MKKITFINGSPGGDNFKLDACLDELSGLLQARGHRVEPFSLRGMKIGWCTGCWGCWVRTPGECVIDDDMAVICRCAIGSDVLVFASPVLMGFTSALLKKAADRMIPLLHPYFEFVNGEYHHRRRYSGYPRLGLLLEKTPGTDEEDLGIIREIYARMAGGLRSRLGFVHLTTDSLEEVADALDSL